MIYSIDAQLLCQSFEHALAIQIVRGNNLNLFTTIPKKNGQNVSFEKGENILISYFLGEFHYHFNVEFEELLDEEGLYQFIINEVSTEKNLRKHTREIVELNALILDSKNMYYATILDISKNGVKIETEYPIQKKTVEVFFGDTKGESNKRKGKITWSKEGESKYYYGIKLK